MRYYQLGHQGPDRLVAVDGTDVYDLSAAKPELTSFRDLARSASIAETDLDAIAERHLDERYTISEDRLAGDCTQPVTADEVWAAGVTYEISEEARTTESVMPEMYLDVYDADRPEIFFKATPSRTVGPDDPVGIRADSTWNVPEPELGIVLYNENVVGFTIGNDMSSRSIEGDNPLYLPQAKVYDRCCALGPCISTDIEDPHALEMSMAIYRDDECVYEEATSTGQMVRDCEELVSFFTAHNSIPELSVLLTGTSLVPDDEFTLAPDDRIQIDVENIGVLANRVTTV